MSSKLPRHIELSSIDSNDVGIKRFQISQIHQKQLNNNYANIHNTSKLIKTLGGIDQILSDYLSSKNDMILTSNQCLQSNNGQYVTIMQYDGNLVTYPIWSHRPTNFRWYFPL